LLIRKKRRLTSPQKTVSQSKLSDSDSPLKLAKTVANHIKPCDQSVSEDEPRKRLKLTGMIFRPLVGEDKLSYTWMDRDLKAMHAAYQWLEASLTVTKQ
jgi:hypothetical protein